MQDTVKKNSALKRHLTAVVALPVFIAYVYYLPPFPYFLGFIIVAGMIAMRELFNMYRVPAGLNAASVAVGGFLIYIFCQYPEHTLQGILFSVTALILHRMFWAKTPSGSMSDLGPVGIGFLYIVICMSFFWSLRDMENGLAYTFVLYASVWLADSMAYYIGSNMGRHKLCPSISPGKTIEGAVGSVIGGILGVVIIKYLFGISNLSAGCAVLTGAVMGVTTLIGDLIESMFKRDAGVKDSGTLMPGHGGMFDRIDGMLISGPVLYFIVRYF
ncbi:phosphatidate cytidylyltransferase [bacterium BMS3Abin09]|nr:phosphatidate cytidylyltransferase [bacterium BMS3Abin09]GBE40683.1 phosphatidate cytidylyltransferase [bacterium BMS3Bbin09]